MGGLLGDIDVRLPFWTAAALCIVNVAYGALVLRESLHVERRAAFKPGARQPHRRAAFPRRAARGRKPGRSSTAC